MGDWVLDKKDVETILSVLPKEILENQQYILLRDKLMNCCLAGLDCKIIGVSLSSNLCRNINSQEILKIVEKVDEPHYLSFTVETDCYVVNFIWSIIDNISWINLNIADIETWINDTDNLYMLGDFDIRESLGYSNNSYNLEAYNKNGKLVYDCDEIVSLNKVNLPTLLHAKIKKDYKFFQEVLLCYFSGPVLVEHLYDEIYNLTGGNYDACRSSIIDKLKEIIGNGEVVISNLLIHDLVCYLLGLDIDESKGLVLKKVDNGFIKYNLYTDFNDLYYTVCFLDIDQAFSMFRKNEKNFHSDEIVSFFGENRII